jgi:hypothetical protein
LLLDWRADFFSEIVVDFDFDVGVDSDFGFDLALGFGPNLPWDCPADFPWGSLLASAREGIYLKRRRCKGWKKVRWVV